MDLFYQTFGFVAAICTGIITLTLFFTAVGHFKQNARGFEMVKIKGLIKDGKLVSIQLRGSKTIEGRFVGFTNRTAGKGYFPYQLSNMLVLESAKGTRTFVRADSVTLIQEVEAIGA